MGIIKPGKVVILLGGRYAGKKAVVVKTCEEGTESRKFPHALVAGIDKAPRKVTKSMSAKKIARKTRMKAFVKAVNYTHLLPTRYTVDPSVLDLTGKVDEKTTTGPDARKTARKEIQKNFTKKYNSQPTEASRKKASLDFFFKKLRF